MPQPSLHGADLPHRLAPKPTDRPHTPEPDPGREAGRSRFLLSCGGSYKNKKKWSEGLISTPPPVASPLTDWTTPPPSLTVADYFNVSGRASLPR